MITQSVTNRNINRVRRLIESTTYSPVFLGGDLQVLDGGGDTVKVTFIHKNTNGFGLPPEVMKKLRRGFEVYSVGFHSSTPDSQLFLTLIPKQRSIKELKKLRRGKGKTISLVEEAALHGRSSYDYIK
jgi:hypothetical protein